MKESKVLYDPKNSNNKSINIYLPISLTFFCYIIIGTVNYYMQTIPYYIYSLSNFYIYNNKQVNELKLLSEINKNSINLIIYALFFYNFGKSIGSFIYYNTKYFIKLEYFILFTLLSTILFSTILIMNKNTVLYFIFFCIFSMSNGISFMPILELIWMTFPLKKGLIFGVINSLESFSILIFLLFFVPENKNNLILNIFIGSISFIFLGLLLIFKENLGKYFYIINKKQEVRINKINRNEIIKKEGTELKDENIKEEELKEKMNEENAEIEIDEEDDDYENKEGIEGFIENVTDKKFLCFLAGYFLIFFSNYIISIFYVPFSISLNNTNFEKSYILLFLYYIIYIISSLLWGYFLDKKGFKYSYIILCLISVLSLFLFIPAYYFTNLVILISLINSIAFSGVTIIFYPTIYKDFFTFNNRILLVSVLILFSSFSYLIGSSIIKYFGSYFSGMIIILFCLSLISLSFLIIIKIAFQSMFYGYQQNSKFNQGLRELKRQNELRPLSK